jgi:hypothetical protein
MQREKDAAVYEQMIEKLNENWTVLFTGFVHRIDIVGNVPDEVIVNFLGKIHTFL